ncbi:HvfC/BufC family peptide modification chaperone [Sphingomonas sp. PAMC 26605]|uniref:HvfC/BufC family peptide modification chaperone n=1 Tax=Sphingomonas sp. PAMC 26605 TaxID=1112214 RepID=UPI00026CCAF4|nr:putative DNA-binding domain-containing protein [Sphingomonas sp. PAMC 26605]
MLDAADFQHAFGEMLASQERSDDPAMRRALAIHRNTASKAARDALFANYPVTAAMVGEAAFAACAASYIEVAPPREARLCLYGDRFAHFIDAWTPFGEAPYLGAVAALERHVIEALFAADRAPLDALALSRGIDPEAALHWHPATRTAKASTPAASLWMAHQPEAAPDALDEIVWGEEMILVTRPGDAVEVRVIDAPTSAFLTGKTLAQAAANASAEGGDVSTIFASLLSAGAFAQDIPRGK